MTFPRDDLQALAGEPRRSEACLSDLELDQLVAARSPTVRQQAHVEQCDRCRARLATFQAASAQTGLTVERLLARAAPPREAAAVVRRPAHLRGGLPARAVWSRRSRAVALAAAGGLAVSAAIVLLWPTLSAVPNDAVAAGQGAIRSKGAAMRMYLRRDGEVTRARSGDTFREGDQLRFVVRAPAEAPSAWFLMLGVEASGKMATYYPFGGERSMRIDVGSEVQLPDSLVLDGSPDTELLLSVFSDEPLEAADVAAAVRARGSPTTLDRLLDLDLPGQVHFTVLRKE